MWQGTEKLGAVGKFQAKKSGWSHFPEFLSIQITKFCLLSK